MDIPEILNKITDFILHFDFGKFVKNSKFGVILFAIIAMLIIIFGALFALIPQF